MILYLAGSVPLGVLGDRVARNRLIAVGVGIWGAATFLSGLARSYGQLFAARALVGIGEASYGPTASAMVSDLFPRERRGFVNALFNAAIPLGGAIGVIAGGLVGLPLRLARRVPPGRAAQPRAHRSWPGASATRCGAGRTSLPAVERAAPPVGFFEGVVGLFRTPTFVMVCAVGMLVAFSIGAFNHWLPLYLHRVKQFSVPEASFWFGDPVGRPGDSSASSRGGFVGDCWRAGPRPGTSSRSPGDSSWRRPPAS